MLITTAKDGESKDFPLLAVVDGRRIGLRIKVLKLTKGRLTLGIHLLDNGEPMLPNSPTDTSLNGQG